MERHSAFPTNGVPTYHIDEFLLIDGLRTDYRLFSRYSILADGPLSLNLTYLPLRLAGDKPPEHWDSGRALLVGRWISAVADCLAFPILWSLLLALGVSDGLALFGVALLAFAPNHVFNAHFARSHMVAGLLQLGTWFAAARALTANDLRARWTWYGASGLAAILAGAARYPFLTLGVFPIAAAIAVLRDSGRRGELKRDLAGFAGASVAALALGVTMGFDLRPLEILRAGFQVQQSVGQIPWSDPGAIARSATSKVLSTISFPGGASRALLLVGATSCLLPATRSERRSRFRGLVLLIVGWALLYLILWAKFGVPWQRYAMPFSLAMGIAGIFGLDRLARHVASRWPGTRWRALSMGAAVALIAPGAFMSLIIVQRFVQDTKNPHYVLSEELARRRPATVYVREFWSWNSLILSPLLPAGTALRFVPDRETACRNAAPGDLLVDFIVEPLGGACTGRTLVPAFRLSNLGPPGYPFPSGERMGAALERHYEDYHYLFEDIRGLTVQGPRLAN